MRSPMRNTRRVYRPRAGNTNVLGQALSDSLSRLQGDADAFEEKKTENEVGGETKENPVQSTTDSEGTSESSMDLKICSFSKIDTVSTWKMCLAGGMVGGIFGGLFGGGKTAIKSGLVGSSLLGIAGSLWNIWAKRSNVQKYKITDSITQLEKDEIIELYNAPPIFSAFPGTVASLVGEFSTSDDDARPPMQRAARVQEKLTLQCWRIVDHFERRYVVVNGDLLGECLSELQNKSPEAIAVGIQSKTANVCHYNASAILQAATNRDTNYLATLFLGN